ncbi:MAG: hypothetical protein UU10_C0051G0003 [Parcubacteria group bacterium GW2011_GWF1_40_6]|nr:MAG: hypothetical protein UU10_C0051G0003 [Parcubacteria group bacterium GW2011_GWF1_40_6]
MEGERDGDKEALGLGLGLILGDIEGLILGERDGEKEPAACVTTNFGSLVVPAVSARTEPVADKPATQLGAVLVLSPDWRNPSLVIPVLLIFPNPVLLRG